MKIHKLETHDRLLHFKKQASYIDESCQNMINQRPFGDYPFYIFAHARTTENGSGQRLILQPRLTKPKAQTNSMLFKAYPKTNIVKIIWMIPDRNLWNNYNIGMLTENQTIAESIHKFLFNRDELEKKEEDDLNDETIDSIYRQISTEARMKQLYKSRLNKIIPLNEVGSLVF